MGISLDRPTTARAMHCMSRMRFLRCLRGCAACVVVVSIASASGGCVGTFDLAAPRSSVTSEERAVASDADTPPSGSSGAKGSAGGAAALLRVGALFGGATGAGTGIGVLIVAGVIVATSHPHLSVGSR